MNKFNHWVAAIGKLDWLASLLLYTAALAADVTSSHILFKHYMCVKFSMVTESVQDFAAVLDQIQ
jgi:hypothetical protein